jgi:hypothetical protein
MDDLITIQQAADLLPWSVPTLRRWRATWPDGECKGPRPRIVEGRLFYLEHEVREWLRRQVEAEVQAVDRIATG